MFSTCGKDIAHPVGFPSAPPSNPITPTSHPLRNPQYITTLLFPKPGWIPGGRIRLHVAYTRCCRNFDMATPITQDPLEESAAECSPRRTSGERTSHRMAIAAAGDSLRRKGASRQLQGTNLRPRTESPVRLLSGEHYRESGLP